MRQGLQRVAQARSSLIFAGAALNARVSLDRVYQPLVAKNPTHRVLRGSWFVVYAVVGVQMGWDLRPFVWNPEMEVQFFGAEIGNAYVEVARVLSEAVGLI